MAGLAPAPGPPWCPMRPCSILVHGRKQKNRRWEEFECGSWKKRKKVGRILMRKSGCGMWNVEKQKLGSLEDEKVGAAFSRENDDNSAIADYY